MSPGVLPLWEYKVVHLNLSDRPGPGARQPESAAPASEPSKADSELSHLAAHGIFPFSRAYLEQEFPDFYADQSTAECSQADSTPAINKSPAEQLQDFLNSLGCAGWALLGIQHVGKYHMMVFSRPIAGGDKGVHSDQLASDSILQRLERLEAACAVAKQPGALDLDRTFTTAEAAALLGFRSLAPLTTPLRQAGEPVGLQRQGPNGLVAQYLGVGVPSRGGRSCRIWQVEPHPSPIE